MEVKLIVLGEKNHGREIPVKVNPFLIGRAEGCHLRPGSERVSRKHCAIIVKDSRVFIHDFGSTNGTLVNEERVSPEQVAGHRELKNGNILKVGGLEFEVQLTVSVGGERKAKVHSIEEAAARTVKNVNPLHEEDPDISDWLAGEQEDSSKSASSHDKDKGDTISHSLPNTTTIFIPSPEEQGIPNEKKKSQQITKKPTSVNSRSAADETLRQFFHRR